MAVRSRNTCRRRARAVIGGETGRQHHADPAAWRGERQRALEKQLIQVGVAVALQRIDARLRANSVNRTASAPRGMPRGGVTAVARSISHGGLPMTASNPARRAAPRRRRRRPRGTRASSGRSARPRLRQRGFEKRPGDVVGEGAAPKPGVGQRAERDRTSAPAVSVSEPVAAPEIADVLPAVERRALPAEIRQRAFLRPYLLDRVSGLGRERRSDSDRLSKRLLASIVVKQRQR